MELGDYAQALGAAQRLIPAWDEPERRRAELQQQQAQTQLMQQQVAASQQQQQDGQAFQSALGTLPQNPTAQQYRQLATQFPRFFKPISEVADGMDAQHKTQTISHLSQIGAAIAANKPDLAVSQIQRHIDADKAAGNQPDEEDMALVKMLQSGDPEQVKAAGVLVHGTLNGLDPKTAEGLKPDEGDHFASTGDNAIYDKRTGAVIREGSPKQEYRTVDVFDANGTKVGERVIALGGTEGGGQASGGAGAANGSAAPSGRTQYGWTPRRRNGGDNDDAAVDGKIAGMSKALGIAPNSPLDGMSNMQIAQALTLSEGGPGSIADRRNNPGNLTDPKTGDYRRFKTKQEGLAAAAAQVARNRARGQNTIQTMVEGLPVGGSNNGRGSGVVYESVGTAGAKSKDAPSGYRYQADGQTLEPIPGGPADKGRSGGGKALPDAIVKRLEPKIDARDQLTSALGNFKDDFGGHTVLGDASNSIQSVTGLGATGQRDWWAQFRATDNVIRNQLFGASLTDGEKSAYNATTITPRMAPSEIRRNLKSRLQIVNKAIARQRNVLTKNGFSQDAVGALFDPLGQQQQAPAGSNAPTGFRILRVRPK